jgi:hypothetical protein
MLAATLVPEDCSSGHRGKFCRWTILSSSALANTIVSQTKVAMHSSLSSIGNAAGMMTQTSHHHLAEKATGEVAF